MFIAQLNTLQYCTVGYSVNPPHCHLTIPFLPSYTHSLTLTHPHTQCSDNGTSPLQSSATVTVNIMDANDLPPSFLPLPPGLSLSEDTMTGTVVARVTATDGDSGSNGEVRGHLWRNYDSVVCIVYN